MKGGGGNPALIYQPINTTTTMNIYYIKIVADDHYQRVECSGNTPALLEDAIKAAVKEFYKEGHR